MGMRGGTNHVLSVIDGDGTGMRPDPVSIAGMRKSRKVMVLNGDTIHVHSGKNVEFDQVSRLSFRKTGSGILHWIPEPDTTRPQYPTF